jgi:DNA polymerase family A/Uracil DNA glycosylase superfamily
VSIPLPVLQWNPQQHGARCDICPWHPQGGPTGRSPFVRHVKAKQKLAIRAKAKRAAGMAPMLRVDGTPVESSSLGDLPDREITTDSWRPVMPEMHPEGHIGGLRVLAIGSYPGSEEKAIGRPFVGQAGAELMRAFAAAGISRPQVSMANACQCAPPNNDADYDLAQIRIHNAAARKLRSFVGEKEADRQIYEEGNLSYHVWPTPFEACAPFVSALALNFDGLLLLGSEPAHLFMPGTPGILELRGAPANVSKMPAGGLVVEGQAPPSGAIHRWKVMPTVNPAFVRRLRRFRQTIARDLARAVRHFHNALDWKPPVMVIQPTSLAEIYQWPAKLDAFLQSNSHAVVDIETLPGVPWSAPGALSEELPEDVLLALEADDESRAREEAMDDDDFRGKGYKKKKDKNRDIGSNYGGHGSKQAKMRALDPLRAVIDRVAIGNKDLVYLVKFISKETGERFMPPSVEWEVWKVLARFAVDPRVEKRTWNGAGYDSPALARHFALAWARAQQGLTSAHTAPGAAALPGTTPGLSWMQEINAGGRLFPHRDLIQHHKLVDGELPHNLAYAASERLDAPPWKLNYHAADDGGTDADRDYYACMDGAGEDRLGLELIPATTMRGQDQLLGYDHLKGTLCQDMHALGMRVDPTVHGEMEAHTLSESIKWLKEAARLAGRPEPKLDDKNGVKKGSFNANSGPQVANVLYKEWGLTIYKRTATGAPSTDDEVLIKLFSDPNVNLETQRPFVRAVRKVRSRSKERGTYLYPTRPWSRGGAVWPDGRIRANFSSHTVISGRISCSEFPLQGMPIPLRTMFQPEQDCAWCKARGFCGVHAFVADDADQLELRILTAVTQCRYYLNAIAQGWDPHGMLAELVWEDKYRQADGYVDPKTGRKPTKKSSADKMRDLVKRVVYAACYSAKIETVWEQIVSAEDASEELVFPDFTIDQAAAIVNKWKALCPEIVAWWGQTVERWRLQRFIRDYILGRRRDCLDSDMGEEELNTMVNGEIQFTAAAHMDVSLASVYARFPIHFAGPNTGFIGHHHDSLILEVPVEMARECAADLQKAMTRAYPTLPGLTLTAGEPDIKARWAPLTCKTCKGDRDLTRIRGLMAEDPVKWGALAVLDEKKKAKACDCLREAA